MPQRINFIASYATIAFVILVVGLFWGMAPMVIGRSLAPWEISVVAVVVVAIVRAWRWRKQRQKRRELDSLRDSALW